MSESTKQRLTVLAIAAAVAAGAWYLYLRPLSAAELCRELQERHAVDRCRPVSTKVFQDADDIYAFDGGHIHTWEDGEKYQRAYDFCQADPDCSHRVAYSSRHHAIVIAEAKDGSETQLISQIRPRL